MYVKFLVIYNLYFKVELFLYLYVSLQFIVIGEEMIIYQIVILGMKNYNYNVMYLINVY